MSSIIGGFKSAVTRNIRADGYDFAWQRNLWEHIIRDNNDYDRIDIILQTTLSAGKKTYFITNNPCLAPTNEVMAKLAQQ